MNSFKIMYSPNMKLLDDYEIINGKNGVDAIKNLQSERTVNIIDYRLISPDGYL